jgi:hypothetical protein
MDAIHLALDVAPHRFRFRDHKRVYAFRVKIRTGAPNDFFSG